MIRQRLTRTVLAATAGLCVAAAGLLTAPAAQAADTSHTTVSCSTLKIRKAPVKTAPVVGVGYRKDKVAYDQWAYKRSEKTWYTRGMLTRRSDGKKIRGYMVYQCANPYRPGPPPPHRSRSSRAPVAAAHSPARPFVGQTEAGHPVRPCRRAPPGLLPTPTASRARPSPTPRTPP
ncbi:hypothetical protein [Streptomyces sp. NPDC007904]|uniref:hypothetical protein n=1 Tax=Streptomyces sp. NPDC007904 TaxID=3364787 RepID=UPI0036EDC6B2